MPLAIAAASSAAWAAMGSQAETALNSGWLLDQTIGAGPTFTAAVSAGSSSTFFFSTGDATAFYLHGRPLQIVQGANTIKCEVVSSSCDAVATQTRVTVNNFINFTTGLSTGALTTVAGSATFPSTGGSNGNLPNDFGTVYMTTLWGL